MVKEMNDEVSFGGCAVVEMKPEIFSLVGKKGTSWSSKFDFSRLTLLGI